MLLLTPARPRIYNMNNEFPIQCLDVEGAVTFIAWTPTTSYNMRKLLLFLAGPSVAMMKLKIGSPGFLLVFVSLVR